ncbi:YbaN family protein [Halobacteriovorax sp. HLS]|uniref:YbaN family protein n=1 Tax=Halobacteriovorax sp. HLS TaxID=2234000 RepID=UPI000FD94F0C|nr:YbaN family protein [Halobacteriovorax sp. HLS]
MLTRTTKLLFIALGLCTLVLGVIGIFLPILPTTPFVLLSAYFFSKGSEKLHSWLISRPKIGKIIQDWERDRVIGPKSKLLATFMITLLFSYTIIFVNVQAWIKVIVALSGLCVLLFILTRNSYPKSS